MNKVFLFGKAGTDAQERRENFVTFTLATTEARKTKECGWEKMTEWHNIVCGAYVAEKAKSVKKGDDVLIEGAIKTHEYNNQNYTQIEVRSITLVKPPKPQQPQFRDDEIPF